jgi:hypothetical protein
MIRSLNEHKTTRADTRYRRAYQAEASSESAAPIDANLGRQNIEYQLSKNTSVIHVTLDIF